MATSKAAKSELRKAVHWSLNQLTSENVTSQSHRIYEGLIALPEYRSAKSISIYLSMPTGEVCTRQIVGDALRKGKTVFVPFLYKKRRQGSDKAPRVMDMVSLQSEADYNALQLDKWGIPTPSETSLSSRTQVLREEDEDVTPIAGPRALLDMMVMPGVAFDRERRRLGHGKGFYDFFLHRYHERLQFMSRNLQPSNDIRMPFLVGLSLEEQLLPEGQVVPTTTSDWQLDALIVGDGSYHENGC